MNDGIGLLLRPGEARHLPTISSSREERKGKWQHPVAAGANASPHSHSCKPQTISLSHLESLSGVYEEQPSYTVPVPGLGLNHFEHLAILAWQHAEPGSHPDK